MRVRNPLGKAQRASLSLKASQPISLVTNSARLDIPPNALKDVSFEVETARDAPAGWHDVAATIDIAGRAFEENLSIAVCSASPKAGPVGYWKLDEGQGTVIMDSSGHRNNGAVQHPKWVEGKRGAALQFDGQSIAIVPDSASLNLRDEVTVAFWLKVLFETGTWQFPVTKFRGDTRRNYGGYLSRDKLCRCFSTSFEQGSFRHSDIATGVSVSDGRWRHVAATCSAFDGQVRIYVDGKLEAERGFGEEGMLFATEPIPLGGGTKGVIDEVVCPRALSGEEITELAR